MNDNLVFKFYGNKQTDKIDCNFDIKELMDNFSFLRFINDSLDRKNRVIGSVRISEKLKL